jgi:hypothetical protein
MLEWKIIAQIWHSEDRASWYILIITNEMHFFSNLFWYRTLHVSDRFTVHHQESQHVIHSNRYISHRLCWLLASKPAQPHKQRLTLCFCVVNRTVCEADHSPYLIQTLRISGAVPPFLHPLNRGNSTFIHSPVNGSENIPRILCNSCTACRQSTSHCFIYFIREVLRNSSISTYFYTPIRESEDWAPVMPKGTCGHYPAELHFLPNFTMTLRNTLILLSHLLDDPTCFPIKIL